MKVESYLNFDGRCEEAIEFYKKAVGAEVQMLLRMKESPEQPPPGMMPPGTENKVMHVALRIGETRILASDSRCQGKPSFHGISLTLNVRDDAEAKRLFNALADGGTVKMPLTKTFFSSSFGTVNDRFGVSWMIVAEH